MIYIAEDDEATRDAICLLLECEELSIEGFASCDALCAAVDPAYADLLILDVQMAGMSGLELLEVLRHRGARVPVILMTGNPTPQVQARAAAAGATVCLDKPFPGDELVGFVKRALGRPA